MINAVIFDLDGTLIHSLPGLASSLNRILDRHQLPTHSELKVRGFIGNGIRKLVERAAPINITPKTLDLICAQMSSDYAESWKSGTSPYPNITSILHELSNQGIALAVFSNKPHIFCREMTDYLFPDIVFTEVIGQREGIPTKPDPAGAYDIAKNLGVSPDNIVFLGDSTIDIATARNAGMIQVAANWGYHDLPALEGEKPTHIILDIRELPSLLQKIN